MPSWQSWKRRNHKKTEDMATDEEINIAERDALRQEFENAEAMFHGKCVGIEHRTVHREMTTGELLDARERFVDLRGKIADLEGEKDLAKKRYDGLIKPLASESDRLLMEIRTRLFDIDEDCYVMHDYSENKVRYISKTTLTVVSARDMTGSDRQKAIDFDGESGQDVGEAGDRTDEDDNGQDDATEYGED